MNIFVLDLDPYITARYHCDQHVTKMILESAQLLSTEAHRLGVAHKDSYKPTHQNHPCTLWLRNGPMPAHWLHNLICGLSMEHRKRFGTAHKSEWIGRKAAAKIWDYYRYIPKADKYIIEQASELDFALAMPDKFKTTDPVESYREYYKAKNLQWQVDSKEAMRYTNTDRPDWLVLP